MPPTPVLLPGALQLRLLAFRLRAAMISVAWFVFVHISVICDLAHWPGIVGQLSELSNQRAYVMEGLWLAQKRPMDIASISARFMPGEVGHRFSN